MDGVSLEKNILKNTLARMRQDTKAHNEVIKWKVEIGKDINKEGLPII